MKNIVIIYYSQTGNTEALARGVALGVESEDIQATLKKVGETTNDDLIKADAIIVGSPVYFGSMAAPIKKMFDQSVAIRRQLKDKIGAAFATAGHHSGGKETTILSIIQAMLIHEMIVVGDPISVGGHYGAATTGAPDAEAIRQGEALGNRVAGLVNQLNSGK